jgi:hypothetical protein
VAVTTTLVRRVLTPLGLPLVDYGDVVAAYVAGATCLVIATGHYTSTWPKLGKRLLRGMQATV